MLNKKLKEIHNNLDDYFIENEGLRVYDEDIMNFVLDIEACPTGKPNEVMTYSIAIMSCDNTDYICNKYNKVEDFMNMILNLNCKKVNFYVHNLLYDFKPFIIDFITRFNATQIFDETYTKNYYNMFENKKEELTLIKKSNSKENSINTFKMCLKKGQLYNATFYGNRVKTVDKRNKVRYIPIEINWFDTLKIVPYSLQKCCSAFINLDLPKDGLDYDKIRNIDDELTKEEKIYIYNDVYGLSNLVRKLIIEGIEVDGKLVRYSKLTNSSQSLSDYKDTLLDDYLNRKNTFSNNTIYHNIDTRLMDTKFFKVEDMEQKKEILFKNVFPPQNYFVDRFIRQSYYGGLSTVHFENVEKFSKYENKIGQVFDVNSLYPYIMQDRLLPFGFGVYHEKPYKCRHKKFKENYPLYIQEIIIYDMKIKKGKMPFVQVKGDVDFNGREVLTENINKYGKKQKIKLILCNPLLDLLFENYNVNSYKLGCHLAFQGANDLFKNYLEFWGEVKKKSKGANREIAKLRQNALYGKFGTSGDTEKVEIFIEDNTFKVNHTHEELISDNIYVAMSSFITSYAKQYLVQNINHNYKNFLYCDTDSLHLFGNIEDVKGLFIDDKIYGAWKHELTFNDFRYIGSKRYAEKEIKSGKWDIKCCGLSDEIMKKVDDINIFTECEYNSKELSKLNIYTKENDIYYYKDKECTNKIKGLFKSKKSKIVKGGTLIVEQPYQLSKNSFY